MGAEVGVNDPLSIVERKFCLPHWVFLKEFRNGTGYSATRSADALAVGLYASRGQLLIGFEQKVSRADWLRELRDADKAEPICKHCDHWNIVVPENGIVHLDELPPTWGLILATGQRLKTIKAAPRLQAKPVTRNFMAAIIKRAIEDAVKPHLLSDNAKHQIAEREGFERGKLSAAREIEKLLRLEEQVRDFETASGLRINTFTDCHNLGLAVQAVMQGGRTIDRVRNEMIRAVVNIRELAEALEKFIKAISPNGAAPDENKEPAEVVF